MKFKTPQKHKNKHILIMVLCCLIPLAVLGILWAAGIGGNYLFFGIILLCPLLHIVMMMGMHKKDRDSIGPDN